MFKEGVRDILVKLDEDLVGLIPVKLRVRQIAALLVLDKVRSHYTSTRGRYNTLSSPSSTWWPVWARPRLAETRR